MALLSVLAFVATLLVATECVQQSIPPIVISGSNGIGSCPAEDALEMAKQNISATIREMIAGTGGTSNRLTYPNCKAALQSGQTRRLSGVYMVQPDSLEPFNVYCDMVTDGGGWTVFQRRQDGSENFYRGWNDYVAGFGNLTGEFWLGLEKIHRLTAINATMLRIDMADFDGNTAHAEYSTFRILDSSTNYVLNVGGYSGTAGDAFIAGDQNENGQAFTTRDRDNDRHTGGNCAQLFRGAWWYDRCHDSNLNGLYRGGPHPDNFADGVIWEPWKGHYYSLRFAEMKLR